MPTIVSDLAEIFSAVWSNDAWMISEALRTDAAWLLGAVVTLVGAALFLALYRYVPGSSASSRRR